MKAIYKSLTVALLATTLVACSTSDDDDNNDLRAIDPGNIVEVAEANGSFTTLVAALKASGLDAVLADETRDFTVFAPTDAAFTAALADLGITAADLLASPNLADILLYHVVADAEIDSSAAVAAAGTTVTTANTDDIGVSLQGMDLFINASRVETPDIDANNGVIHVIDAVLLPTVDDPASGTIAAVAAANGSFDTLVLALQTANLDTVLADAAGKFTVFAPTDAAFYTFLTDAGITANDLLASPDLADILLYHVISGAEVNAAAATAIAGNTVEMGNTDNMALSLSGTDLFANLSKISALNVDASNGIIHVIDTVLTPPADAAAPTQTITQIAQASGNFTTLVLALQAAGLDATLNDASGDFTVFAPTDAAFTALLHHLGISAADLLASPDLSKILLKHVVSGSVDSVTAFTLNGAEVMTLNPDGETVEFEIDSGQFTVDGAQVTTFDIVATNGIIHVIDAVITLD
ncbi:MAG: fasciclin domain-containing protein [Gammaproteobacteria bacterium]|nr:fasciclin domain-containing protein [Gammaproteobacteria bacterium]MDH3857070.1 fasciclin domain-containing protein [Gammaproteobacteria bacterium]